MATNLFSFFDKALPDLASRVTLGKDGKLRWEVSPTVCDTEPQTSRGRRATVFIEPGLPIDRLL